MGVLGLWRLLDPAGKPTAVETLEGKVLAIDVSIWIHQVLQGYKDGKGDSLQNAHLLGLFNRICKLLYFKIKPVFVFDGGVPMLKRNTIATRRKLKSIAGSKAKNLQSKLMSNLIKRFAVNDVFDRKTDQEQRSSSVEISEGAVKSTEVNDLYTVIEQPSTSKEQIDDFDFIDESDYDSSEESSPHKQSKWIGNIHSVNIDTNEFRCLPADVRYDILTDLKDTRKQNSWGRIHEMPPVLNDFSNFQMKRLLKRRHVQESLETAEKEIGGSKTLTLEELDKLLTEQGIETTDHNNPGLRIASDSSSRVIFLNDKNVEQETTNNITTQTCTKGDKLSVKNVPISIEKLSPSDVDFKETSSSESVQEWDEDDNWDSDVDIVLNPIPETSVQSNSTTEKIKKYMLECTSLTEEQISNFIKQKRKKKKKKRKFNKKLEVSLKLKKEDKKNNINEPKSSTSDNVHQSIVANEQILSNIEHLCNKETEKNIFLNSDSTEISNELLDDKSVSLMEISDKVKEPLNISSVQEISSENSDNDDKEFITVGCNKRTEKNTNLLSDEISKDSLVDKTISLKEKSEISEKVLNISNVKEIFSDSSDSDDDFIEVDNSISEASFTRKHETKNSFDIIVKHVNNLENDLFADVFEIEKSKDLSDTMEKETVDLNDENYDLKNLDNKDIKEEQSSKKEESKSDFKNKSPSSESTVESNITSITSSQLSEALNSISLPLAGKDIISTLDILEDERKELNAEIGKLERQAVNITDQMCTEAQELLRLFGIPYIVAPMEAEAQCAYLEQINLTDGTITDDSDIWLFGAKCVYKNFFNNNKTVLQFRSCDIHHHFKLSRQQLIQLALLVGSDYTSGLRGIGPVTAMEILAAFPSGDENLLQGLVNFSDWFKSGKLSESNRTNLRNKLKNTQIADGFPSQSVVQAYLFPTVDESKEKFTWKKPNVNLLFDYVKQKFGWDKLKFEEKINPIMKKLSEGRSQKGIDAYFQFRMVPKNIKGSLSKRLQSAVSRMESGTVEENSIKEKSAKANCNDTEVDDEVDSLLLVKELEDQVLSKSTFKGEANCSKFKDSSTQKSQLAAVNFDKRSEEYIPQKESSRIKAAKNKIHAIEVFNKSKKKSARAKKKVRHSGKILKKAQLSESSSSSS